MPLDGYLRIEGIRGECQEGRHRGWIDATSIDWKVDQGDPVLWAQDLKAKLPARIEPVTFSAPLGSHSASLFEACLKGRPLDKVEFDVLTPHGESKHELLRVELKGCVITSYSTAASGGTPVDTFKVAYSGLKWTYKERSFANA